MDVEKIGAPITDKTVISLHMVVIMLGFAVWLIKLGDKVEHNEKTIISLEINQKKTDEVRNKIDRRLYRIEERLGVKSPEDRED